jgi:two-component system LytT family response regulator
MPDDRIRAVIADDEPTARRGIRQLLSAHADIEVVAEARNGRETVQCVRTHKPDLLFLDVEMPGLDGFGVIAQVRTPEIIFVTAYESFAVNAFDVDAVDYLLKPVSAERFANALVRAREKLGRVRRATHRVVIGQTVVDPGDITCIEAADYYAIVHHAGKRAFVRESLDSLEARLSSSAFVRTHRGFIVSLAAVAVVRRAIVLRDGRSIPISRRRRAHVENALRQFFRSTAKGPTP